MIAKVFGNTQEEVHPSQCSRLLWDGRILKPLREASALPGEKYCY